MALIVPVSGPYTSAFTPGASASGSASPPASLGITSDDGFRLLWTIHKQQIGNDGTDVYGLSRLENIIRGADWNMIFRMREFGANTWNAAWPYGRVAAGAGVNAIMTAIMAQAGAADDTSGYTGSIALTAISGTPASVFGAPNVLTALKVIQAANQQQATDFTSKLRELPSNFELIPYTQTINGNGYTLWWGAS